jgi:hypothetical protein
MNNYTRFLMGADLPDPLTLPQEINRKKPVLVRDFLSSVVLKRGKL